VNEHAFPRICLSGDCVPCEERKGFGVVEKFGGRERKAAAFTCNRRATLMCLPPWRAERRRKKFVLDSSSSASNHDRHMSVAASLKRTMATPPKDSRKVLEGIIGMSSQE
jgi:hypothetical protein